MAADIAAIEPLPTAEAGVAPPSSVGAFWAAFRENKGAVIGLVVVVAICLIAIFADVLAPHSPTEQFRDAGMARPGGAEGGSWRVPLGLACAFFGPLVDTVVTRVMDLIMAVPDLVLAILAVAILGPSLTNTI